MKQNKEHIAFMEMLRRSDSTIFKICLMFTDRDPENVKHPSSGWIAMRSPHNPCGHCFGEATEATTSVAVRR